MKRSTLMLTRGFAVIIACGTALASGDASAERRDPFYERQGYQEMHGYRDDGADPGYVYDDGVFYDYARVIRVEPIIRVARVSTPRRECRDEEVRGYGYRTRGRNSYTPLVLGGILGGVVGNQFGAGSGKDLMTVGGVLLGASLGYDVARQPRHARYDSRVREVCRVSNEYHDEERVDGYRVTYRYSGRTFMRRMDYDPGRRIKVRVSVTP